MNIENITLLADTIEDHAKRKEGLRGIGFNMATFGSKTHSSAPDLIDKCGTVACMAGWAYAIAYPKTSSKNIRTQNIPLSAREWLGLNFAESDELFIPMTVDDLEEITPRQAVRVLRHLAKTGKVDWSKRGRA